MSVFFQRGQYGEIIPPNLAIGVTPEEAIEMLAQDVRERTGTEMATPRRGRSGEGLLRLAASYVHDQNLFRALRGELPTPEGMALRGYVVQIGEPLSLLPLFLEDTYLQTFAPVFQRENDDATRWRIGIEGKGRTAVLEGRCDDAFIEAKRLYRQWANEEERRFADWLSKKTSGMAMNIHVIYWWLQLESQGEADLTKGFRLERWGGHSTFALYTPKGIYILHAASPRTAAKYAYAFIERMISEQPSPDELMNVIRSVVPSPIKDGSRWCINGSSITFQRGGAMVMEHQGNKYEVVIQGNMAKMRKDGRRFRDLVLPQGEAWDNSNQRNRLLMAWCGLIATTGG